MKALPILLILLTFANTPAAEVSGRAQPEGSRQLSQSTVIDRGDHYRVIQREWIERDRAGNVRTHNSRYTIVGNGLHHRADNGLWVESEPRIQLFSSAIVCTGATYRVILNTNLNTDGSVDLETSDGRRFTSHVLGVAFFDPESGRNVWLGQTKDSHGQVASSDTVLYEDAFEPLNSSGIRASVVYRYSAGGFHQDVTFGRQFNLTPADYGLGDQTRLEIVTEIVESPELSLTEHVVNSEADPSKRRRMAEPDVVDQSVSLGEMQITLGHAFRAGRTNRGPRLPVSKRVVTIDGRRALIESVAWKEASIEIGRLPRRIRTTPPRRSWRAGPLKESGLWGIKGSKRRLAPPRA